MFFIQDPNQYWEKKNLGHDPESINPSLQKTLMTGRSWLLVTLKISSWFMLNSVMIDSDIGESFVHVAIDIIMFRILLYNGS